MAKKYEIDGYDEWPFIEENLPNYHQRDDVLYNDIVKRYVNGEDLSEDDLANMKNRFLSTERAERWLDADIKRLFLEAFEDAYLNGKVSEIVLDDVE